MEFGQPIITGMMLTAEIDMDAHLFYELENAFVIFNKAVAFRQMFSIGEKIPMAGMFETHRLLSVEGERIGYIFTSQFKVSSGGGYLIAYMEAKRGTANVSQTVLKTDEMVIYNFPNKGTLAISPVVGEEVLTVFEEQ